MAHALTPNIAMELVFHEAIVTQAYRDSAGVWTWGVGITDASGHTVYPRYLDNPQPLHRCLDVFLQVARTRYLPTVDEVFASQPLNEAQAGAALSFHYNTGALKRATWVKDVLAGDDAAARSNIMSWNRAGGNIAAGLTRRRAAERDLFFDGKWSNDGTTLVVPIDKPAYSPNIGGAVRAEILSIIQELLG